MADGIGFNPPVFVEVVKISVQCSETGEYSYRNMGPIQETATFLDIHRIFNNKNPDIVISPQFSLYRALD